MGRVLISLNDEIETKLRELAKKLYGGKKGSLSIAVEQALIEWIEKQERKSRF